MSDCVSRISRGIATGVGEEDVGGIDFCIYVGSFAVRVVFDDKVGSGVEARSGEACGWDKGLSWGRVWLL